jgi:hypothetical protein
MTAILPVLSSSTVTQTATPGLSCAKSELQRIDRHDPVKLQAGLLGEVVESLLWPREAAAALMALKSRR